jgi:hypothetical protein
MSASSKQSDLLQRIRRAFPRYPRRPGRGDEDERLPLSTNGEPLPAWLAEDWPGAAAMAKVERLRQQPPRSAVV